MKTLIDSEGNNILYDKIVAISPVKRVPLAIADMWFFNILTEQREFRVTGTKDEIAQEREMVISLIEYDEKL